MWGLAGAFLGVYVVVQNLNIPLIIQPQLLGTLALISWGQVRIQSTQRRTRANHHPQCQYYDNKRSRNTSILIVVTVLAVLGGFEAGMVFAVTVSRIFIPHPLQFMVERHGMQ